MSRIGRMPIAIPAGVTVTIAENNHVTVKGPKGTLERALPLEMTIKQEGDDIVVSRPNDLKKNKSLHGLTRTLIHNMVVGVTEGYEKVLEVNGVGYRAAKQGNKLVLSLGYSHQFLTDRTSSKYRVSTRKKSDSTLQRSEAKESLSHTRAKVLSTLLKLSDVKSVRPVRNNRRVSKWLAKNQKAILDLRSIIDYVIVSAEQLRDHALLYLEATTICTLRLLTTQWEIQ